MSKKKPQKFELNFLEEANVAFLRRKKPISTKVFSFSIEENEYDGGKCIRIFGVIVSLYVNLYLYDDNKYSFYVTSAARNNRGKVYFRIDLRNCIKNGDLIVNNFEASVSVLNAEQTNLKLGWEQASENLNRIWNIVSVKAIGY